MYTQFGKRFFDLLAAFIMLLLSWPAWVVLAVLIKRESPGPVFYKQARTGRGGTVFTMYKFRSTVASNNVHDLSQEDQYTKIGLFMRRTSLDELAQLLNVLKGDMSMIGPRPWIHDYWTAMNVEQRQRNRVRPGLTGLAQVYGRNQLSILDKITHDIRYVRQVSVWGDIKIIALTLRNLFEHAAHAIDKYGIHSEIQQLRTYNASSGTVPLINTDELVSVVVPVFNAEQFIASTIESVQAQTYTNWHLILVDDGSTDTSVDIIRDYAEHDKRISLYIHPRNRGTAAARNTGVARANGRFIAFLDADDLWHNEKLFRQVQFMKERSSAFCFTGYTFADATGLVHKKTVNVPSTITYKEALKNTTIFTSTVMLDMSRVSKRAVRMPNIERGQDTATWWQLLRTVDHACGLNELLSVYRRTHTSLSANKLVALRRTWNLYRTIERMSVATSMYYFVWYSGNALRRRV